MKYTSLRSKESLRLEKLANKLLSKSPKKTNDFLVHKKLGKKNNKYVHDLRNRATKEEVIVGKWLVGSGIYFIFQKGFFKPFHRIVDFYLPRRGIVEIDGGYHKTIIDKDNNKDYLWGKYRYMPTLRITNEQVLDGSFVRILKEFVGGRKFKRDTTKKSKYPLSWN